MDKNKMRQILIDYLKVKIEECDWHAVSDAANDLRVLEAKIDHDQKIDDKRECSNHLFDAVKYLKSGQIERPNTRLK